MAWETPSRRTPADNAPYLVVDAAQMGEGAALGAFQRALHKDEGLFAAAGAGKLAM